MVTLCAHVYGIDNSGEIKLLFRMNISRPMGINPNVTQSYGCSQCWMRHYHTVDSSETLPYFPGGPNIFLLLKRNVKFKKNFYITENV